MKMLRTICSLLMAIGLYVPGISHAILIQFQGADPVASPGYSTTFSSFPASSSLSSPQSLDGFTFTQINGQLNDIWTTYNPGGGTGRGWYPNGGDNGFTEIVLSGGGDFIDVGLFVGSGNGSHSNLAYELLNDSVSVLSGVLSGHQVSFHWLAITGGGFDTIRLRDGFSGTLTVADGSHNALAFDRVSATTVPTPATLLLFGLGLAGLGWSRRKKA